MNFIESHAERFLLLQAAQNHNNTALIRYADFRQNARNAALSRVERQMVFSRNSANELRRRIERMTRAADGDRIRGEINSRNDAAVTEFGLVLDALVMND
jgi:hypothetical protein